MKRSNSSFKTRHEFEKRILSFGEYVRVFVAEHEGILQGCLVSPFSQYAAYSCYAGSKPDPVRGAMHLLHWEAMRQFRDLGVQYFDFQGVRINPEKGSKQDGILNYKQGFGGKLVQGYLWKYPLRPFKSAAYSLAVRWLKGGDIVDQEQGKLVTR
jgi:lipid II:glycine glycyltransferase (peptidoglycan interpeptide bridge formation enzyme)